MNIITTSHIQEEVKNFVKPIAYTGLNLPFNSLNDRAFEVLLYQLFKDKLTRDENSIREKYDTIDLMQGVGEMGRDCILSKRGKQVGIIQCKKNASNISKPQFVKELIKCLLFAIQENTLPEHTSELTYYIAVSTGLAGTTKELIRDFNSQILCEPELKKWIQEVIHEYQKLSTIKYGAIKKGLSQILQCIKIERILPQDLELWLTNSPNILNTFFEVRTVTDNTLIKNIETKYLIPLQALLKKEEQSQVEEFHINFKEYLSRSYQYYASARTLVFGNQQKKLEDFYYPLELYYKNHIVKTREYPDDLLPRYKKVLIVDSGGMGKSTIMKWLFINAIKENKGIPIFIELRLLSEKNTLINEIANQFGSLDRSVAQSFILKLIQNGNFIFFFDGYDEIKVTERAAVTKSLSEFISKAGKNEFIVTSRPDSIEGVFGDFQTFHINPLTIPEAHRLIEKLGDFNQRSKALIKKLKESDLRNIREFLKTPLLISLLYKKFEYRESIPFQKQEFYFEVFEALFKAHDLTKGTDYYIRPKESNLSFSEFHRVLRMLGFRSIQENELEYNQTILLKLIEEIKSDLPNINYNGASLLNDLTIAVPLFQKEGLKYRWAHKSIQEYFAAEFICQDTKEEQSQILLAIYKGARFSNLIHVLDLCYDIDPKSFRNSILYDFCKDFLQFCGTTFQSLLSNSSYSIDSIRDRQFRMYIDDNYLIKYDGEFKSQKQAKSYFQNAVGKNVRLVGRVSADNYYVGTIKKRENIRRLLNLLTMKKSPLIKDVTLRDLMYETKDGYFKKSAVNLFHNEVSDPVILITDDPNSPVNQLKYFKNVATLMKGSYLNHAECEKLICDVELDESTKRNEKKLTRGF